MPLANLYDFIGQLYGSGSHYSPEVTPVTVSSILSRKSLPSKENRYVTGTYYKVLERTKW